jgi:hypothetical protein
MASLEVDTEVPVDDIDSQSDKETRKSNNDVLSNIPDFVRKLYQ